jgi:Domain of unknown function (DUF1707)/Cell wall-active antibiotics response 4TMS YvqF
VSEQPDRPKHLDMRASDADRERVAKILHDAMGEGRLTVTELDERLQGVYAAKTLGELVPFTADLPLATGSAMPIPLTQHTPGERVGGTPGATASIAMMSGFHKTGVWVVPRTYTALAFMGGGQLDLTQARFASDDTTIQVFAFMGGVEIIVPDDITVRVTGFGFMGGFDHKSNAEGPPGAPVVTINGFAFMGGVDVKPGRKKWNRDRSQLEY